MTDKRITRAKKALKGAAAAAKTAQATAPSRSTGYRRAWKIKAEAADRALGILSERPE